MEYLSKKEFNLRFLWELQRYPPKVARDLLRECRSDIRFRGWWYAQRRWAKFIGLDKKEDACPVCGSSDWWYRSASGLGGSGSRVCGRCHPNPGKVSAETMSAEVPQRKGMRDETSYEETRCTL